MLSNPFLPKSNCPHQRRLQILADNEATYNVIMTDSDPVRPAESLYQKPFLQLLHDALSPRARGEIQVLLTPELLTGY
jgi:spermidine synthase